ncbi:helix-turn-helix domain-containing protein [Rossellomorea marisflavi]|uniref:helix-turn-helix domain-containing protein n=1 Tax=Rossellomorea marisflavi TaxID=189381 RepID=UPI003459E584
MYISESIGWKIKHIREWLKISQKDLCEGICSQAYISMVEKGDKNISADILFRLAQRLGVNISYFFDYFETKRDDYIQLTMENIRMEIKNRNYEQVLRILTIEKKNPIFFYNTQVEQFFLWNEAICLYQINGDLSGAVNLLDQSLAMSRTADKGMSERSLEILISKAIFLTETNITDSINLFESIIKSLHKHPWVSDKKIPIKIYYNYARILTKEKNYQYSIDLCMKAIKLNERFDLNYLLGELYFQQALNYKKNHEMELSKEFYHKAYMILTLREDKEGLRILKDNFLEYDEK